MAAWAYECHPADKATEPWLVACVTVDAMPAGTRIVRVKVGSHWLCGVVDRSHRVEAEAMLLREVVASDAADCPACAERPPIPKVIDAGGTDPLAAPSRRVDAAAISMLGHRVVVVLVHLDLVNSPGEADMAIADFRPRFGGADVVLMGQQEDGTPQYHGKTELLELLADLPIDRMPWKSYPLG